MPVLPFRVASQEELRKYKEEIVPFQNRVFSALALLEDNIYLTGGTALARFYYEHRISEDLDFFTTHTTLKDILPSVLSILEKEGFDVEVEHVSVSFARLFVNGYKLELMVEPNHYGELIKTDYGIYVNNLEDIGANKISAWEDRAEWKDLIDLYYITKDIPLTKLFEIADMKRFPVAYEMFLKGSALLIKEVSEEEILNFVEELKSTIQNHLKRKEEEILQNLDEWIKRLLWDFPPEQRKIDENSIGVLLRRVEKAGLPLKNVFLTPFKAKTNKRS